MSSYCVSQAGRELLRGGFGVNKDQLDRRSMETGQRQGSAEDGVAMTPMVAATGIPEAKLYGPKIKSTPGTN
jgi:hypothetical protein